MQTTTRTRTTRAKKAITMIRQGDVLLVAVPAPRQTALERVTDSAGQPLAGLEIVGERTGHAHRLPARVYDARIGRSRRTERLLFLERPTPIVHAKFGEAGEVVAPGDHTAIEVPAGWWRPLQQREYAPRRQFRSRSRVD